MAPITVKNFIRQVLFEADEPGVEVPASEEMKKSLAELAGKAGEVPLKDPDGNEKGKATSGGEIPAGDVKPTLATLIKSDEAQTAINNYATLRKDESGNVLGTAGKQVALSKYLLNADLGGLDLVKNFAMTATNQDSGKNMPFNQAFAALSIKAPESEDILLNTLADDLAKTLGAVAMIYSGRGVGLFTTPVATPTNAALFTWGQKIIIALPSIATAYEVFSEPDFAESAKSAASSASDLLKSAPAPGSTPAPAVSSPAPTNESLSRSARSYFGNRRRYSLLQILQEAPGTLTDDVENILVDFFGAAFIGAAKKSPDDAIKELLKLMIASESASAKEAMNKIFLKIKEIEKSLPITDRIATDADFEKFIKKYHAQIITPEIVNDFSNSILSILKTNATKKMLKDIDSINTLPKDFTDLDALIDAMPEGAGLGKALISKLRADIESQGGQLTPADVMSIAKKISNNTANLDPSGLDGIRDAFAGVYKQEFETAREINGLISPVFEKNLSGDPKAQNLIDSIQEKTENLIAKIAENAGLPADITVGLGRLTGVGADAGQDIPTCIFEKFELDDGGQLVAIVKDENGTFYDVDPRDVVFGLTSGINVQVKALGGLLDDLVGTVDEQSALVVARINEQTASMTSDSWANIIESAVKESGESALEISAKALRAQSIGNFFQRGSVTLSRALADKLTRAADALPGIFGEKIAEFLIGFARVLGKLWNPRIGALVGGVIVNALQDKVSGAVYVASIDARVGADIVGACTLYHRVDLFEAAAKNARRISAAIKRVYKGSNELPGDFGTTKEDTVLADAAITAWDTLASNLDSAVTAIKSVAPPAEGEPDPKFDSLTVQESLRIFIRESLRR